MVSADNNYYQRLMNNAARTCSTKSLRVYHLHTSPIYIMQSTKKPNANISFGQQPCMYSVFIPHIVSTNFIVIKLAITSSTQKWLKRTIFAKNCMKLFHKHCQFDYMDAAMDGQHSIPLRRHSRGWSRMAHAFHRLITFHICFALLATAYDNIELVIANCSACV